MTVPDPPPPVTPSDEKRLFAGDDLPDPATAEPPSDLIVDAPLRPLPADPVPAMTAAGERHEPSFPTVKAPMSALQHPEPPTPPPPRDHGAAFVRFIVKQSLTKKSRTDLSRRMVDMCGLTGWQATTLNPDMGDDAKLVILAGRFGKITTEDDPQHLYTELVELSAVSMAWAQSLARVQWRLEKRRQRAARKRKREEKRKARRKDKDTAKDKGKGG